MDYAYTITFFPGDRYAQYQGVTVHRTEDGAKREAQRRLDDEHRGCGWEQAVWSVNRDDQDRWDLARRDLSCTPLIYASVERLPVEE